MMEAQKLKETAAITTGILDVIADKLEGLDDGTRFAIRASLISMQIYAVEQERGAHQAMMMLAKMEKMFMDEHPVVREMVLANLKAMGHIEL